MSILISGSLAYDYIMNFPDSFKNHILPDKIHILNVSFVVDKLKREFGGTAGNIAYTTKLLGGDPIILAPLGSDGGDYLDTLKRIGIDTNHIPLSSQFMTSSAHIVTDADDNQITPFYPGALDEADQLKISDVKKDIRLVLISPTKKEAMIAHAKEAYEMGIEIVFDPGQQISALSPQELMLVIGQAKFLIANDYEMEMIETKTGWNEKEILEHVDVYIKTLGDKGSIIKTKEETIVIDACKPQSVDDPTGAGDAYRAGFFVTYTQGKPLRTCGQVASLAATYAVENYGTQNHTYTKKEFIDRYKENYSESLSLE